MGPKVLELKDTTLVLDIELQKENMILAKMKKKIRKAQQKKDKKENNNEPEKTVDELR